MEGRPWLRILFILVGFALFGWPVWSMTGRESAAPVKESPAGPAQPLHVEVSLRSHLRCLIWNTSEKQSLREVLSCPDPTGQEKREMVRDTGRAI
jgi:hypothetical protein